MTVRDALWHWLLKTLLYLGVLVGCFALNGLLVGEPSTPTSRIVPDREVVAPPAVPDLSDAPAGGAGLLGDAATPREETGQ